MSSHSVSAMFTCIENLQAPEIRHFLYKSRKTSCLTSPRIPPVYSQEEDEKRSARGRE